MKKVILLCLFIQLSSSLLYADDKTDFIRKQKLFIHNLYQDKRYFDAIAEIERLKAYRDKPELDYFILLNYYLAEQYRTAINLCPDRGGGKVSPSDFIKSMSYLKLEKYNESYESLSRFSYHAEDPFNMDLFMRRLEPLLLSGKLEKISVEEVTAAPFLCDSMNFTALRDELAGYREIGLKSPAGVALMSAVVPGLGQVYSGYLSEGLISLASVAATTFGGAYMHNRGSDGVSYTLYFFSALFYTGNIYGGYNSAERRNVVTLREWYSTINKKYGEYNPASYIDTGRILE